MYRIFYELEFFDELEFSNRVTDKHLGKLLSIVQRHTILPFPAENSVYGSTNVIIRPCQSGQPLCRLLVSGSLLK